MEVFSVKVTGELRERIRALMDGSGMQGKDFMEEVVKLYELQAVKSAMPSVSGDIEELQALTKRMYDIYVGLVERSSTLMKDRETSFQAEIETKNRTISLIQEKLDKAQAELETLKTEKEPMSQLKEDRERLRQREKELEAETVNMQKQHDMDLQQAQLEKEKALLELREKHQSNLEHLSTEYNERVKALLKEKSPQQKGHKQS
jgi:DNA repair exonuclease SbcCD ATPase subunit